MNVDLIDVRDQAIGYATEAASFVADNALEIGVVLLGVGALLACDLTWRHWLKRKGYRMVLRERDSKIDELLTRIINDGLFDAECKGEISRQEVRRKYAELSTKLNLPDLVPQKVRCSIVKNQIKTRLIKEYHVEPKAFVKTQKFSERIGSFATKFWRTKSV